MAENAFALVTPGEIIKEEFLTEYGYRRTSWRKRLASRRTVSLKSSTIDGASRPTPRFD